MIVVCNGEGKAVNFKKDIVHINTEKVVVKCLVWWMDHYQNVHNVPFIYAHFY